MPCVVPTFTGGGFSRTPKKSFENRPIERKKNPTFLAAVLFYCGNSLTGAESTYVNISKLVPVPGTVITALNLNQHLYWTFIFFYVKMT